MTTQEKIIVSAYTGYLMCDFAEVHKYIESKLGRPVFVHELADDLVRKELHEKAKSDFVALCMGDTEDISLENKRLRRELDEAKQAIFDAAFEMNAGNDIEARHCILGYVAGFDDT